MTGLGGGAGSLFRHSGGIVNPFDNMSNFSGATRVGSTNVIYYPNSGNYTFTDPNGGASTYRFTVVGAGGCSMGDGGGWYGVIGGGGGGGARGEIQTSSTLNINVGQGGASPGYLNITSQQLNQTYVTESLNTAQSSTNAYINRMYGRGGWSSVRVGNNMLIKGTGGMPGMYGYYSTLNSSWASWGLNGYNAHNGGRGTWHNGGFGTTASAGGVTVNNGTTEYGGTGGCAANKSSSAGAHPRDTYNTTGADGNGYVASTGEGTTYAGGGGGGGSDYDNNYSSSNTQIAGANGANATGLNSLLSGSGVTSKGGNGSNANTHGNQSTRGTAGGGCGGNARWSNSDSWTDSFVGGDGIVIVEWIA